VYRAALIESARRTGLLDTIGEARVFHTIDEAVEALSKP
jgi:hypothetical protein